MMGVLQSKSTRESSTRVVLRVNIKLQRQLRGGARWPLMSWMCVNLVHSAFEVKVVSIMGKGPDHDGHGWGIMAKTGD